MQVVLGDSCPANNVPDCGSFAVNDQKSSLQEILVGSDLS